MTKKMQKKEMPKSLPKKNLYLIRGIFILIALIAFYVYGRYYNGFTNLIVNLKNATNIFKYILIFFIIFLIILILLNIKFKKKNKVETTTDLELKDQQYLDDLKNVNSTNNGLKYLIIFVIFIFGILIICSLIEFMLPLLIIYAILFIIYFITYKIATIYYQKKH